MPFAVKMDHSPHTTTTPNAQRPTPNAQERGALSTVRQAPRLTSCWNEYQLEKAYQQGHEAAASGLAKPHSSYPDDVLNAAFEAGFADAVAGARQKTPAHSR